MIFQFVQVENTEIQIPERNYINPKGTPLIYLLYQNPPSEQFHVLQGISASLSSAERGQSSSLPLIRKPPHFNFTFVSIPKKPSTVSNNVFDSWSASNPSLS